MPAAQPSPADGRSAIVVGAGIVGTCCAVYLQREGFRVALIERDRPGEACSLGNAGNIGLSSFAPYSLPGMIWRVPRLLLNRRSALKVRPLQFPRSMPWFIRFLRAGSPKRVAKIIEGRKALLVRALEAYEPILAEARGRDLIQTKGKLMLFESDAAFAAAGFDLRVRREGGARLENLSADEVRQLQPGLSPHIQRGVFLPDLCHCVNPLRLTQTLAEHFVRRGGRLINESVTRFEPNTDGAPRVVTDQATHAADVVVLAAGVWSKALAAQLGSRVPIESQRGYHAQLPDPGVEIRVPLMSPARNILMTPMEEGLRCTGIAEHAGIEAEPNYALADLVLGHAKELVPGLKTEGLTRWVGQRPSTPDSLPVIGRAPRFPNVLFAFGHGHTGLTMGAITGRLVAEIATGRPTTVDIAPYQADRF